MPRKALRRVGWGLLAFVGAILLLELALQLGALVVSLAGRDEPGEGIRWQGDSLRIISMGDSNTYGLYLEHDQAYPAVFERRWNATRDAPGIEVLNLAYPGTDSSRVLAQLPRALADHEPDILTLMIGINDFWTPPSETANRAAGSGGVSGWLREHSRVYKLVYMARQQVAGPTRRPRTAGASPDMERLHGNLLRIAELTRTAGVRLVLLTYPYGEVQAISDEQIRRVADEAGLQLIDIAEVFREPCAGDGREELLFFDNHPREKGHELIAETLLEALR